MSEVNILTRLNEEVLLSGPETTLPINLSDYWLAEIQQSLERYFNNEEGAEESGLSLPMAAVMHILFAKEEGEQLAIPVEEMFKYLEYYRVELTLEEVRRKKNIKAEPATIDSIFTNREVMIS